MPHLITFSPEKNPVPKHTKKEPNTVLPTVPGSFSLKAEFPKTEFSKQNPLTANVKASTFKRLYQKPSFILRQVFHLQGNLLLQGPLTDNLQEPRHLRQRLQPWYPNHRRKRSLSSSL